MSWQLGAFAVLAVGLAGGFAWYERTAPDARIVALVAALAAFAALGRIAFAAVPNVKPTTDIVLVSGYVLGAGPGFVVGALSGLASNFFFGQGPWTPWQMAGWGVTGMIGAGLALLTRGRLRRWPLVLVCTVVGFAFTALQDVGDWVTYSDHSLAQLGVYVGKGLGFDGIHAAGCLAFALAFGPALARSIGRFTTRLQVTWQAVAPVVVAVVLAGWLAGQSGSGVAWAATPSPTAYLLSAQNGDGGFGPAPGEASSSLYSGWAALGLAAAGHSPQDVRHGRASVIDYLRTGVGSASDPGSLERTILVARAAGLPATNFGGRDLLAALGRDVRGDGSVSDQTNLTSFAVLALRAANVSPSSAMLAWLVRQEDGDGGFNFASAGGASDVDDTGAALEALAGAAGDRGATARARATAFIRGQQDSDGGFGASQGAGSNAQSTAWAIQGLIATGTDPASLHRHGAPSPVSYLQALIAPDGHVRYARGSDQTPIWVTGEALMALAGKPLPLSPVPVSAGAARPARAAGRHRAAAAPARAAHKPSAAPRLAAASPISLRLATDLGVISALALAPVGVG